MSDEKNRTEETQKGGKAKKRTIILLVVVIAALVGVILFLVFRNSGEEKRNVVVTPDNVDEVIADMDEAEYTEPGYYETSMTTTWHFADGESVSEDAYVANVANNTNDVYFDVVLSENEDTVIYKSPVIPIGSSLEQIALDEPLEDGSYDCVVIYHLVDDEQNTISTLRVTVTVIVGDSE